MNKHMWLVIFLALVLLVSGCATSDQNRTKAEGAGIGAAIGGLAGYLIGEEKGALIGATAGAGVGFLAGREVAKRKAEYATRENFLEAEITRTAEYNESIRAYNTQNTEELAALEEEAEALRAAYETGAEEKSVLLAKQADLKERLAQHKELEEDLLAELKVQNEILEQESAEAPEDDPYLAKLEKEVQELRENIQNLQEDSTQLASIDERLSV
ncbi:MAG: YMGG-like glycine zipper-containing protein [Thermodesulfobacteriota bacterium]